MIHNVDSMQPSVRHSLREWCHYIERHAEEFSTREKLLEIQGVFDGIRSRVKFLMKEWHADQQNLFESKSHAIKSVPKQAPAHRHRGIVQHSSGREAVASQQIRRIKTEISHLQRAAHKLLALLDDNEIAALPHIHERFSLPFVAEHNGDE